MNKKKFIKIAVYGFTIILIMFICSFNLYKGSINPEIPEKLRTKAPDLIGIQEEKGEKKSVGIPHQLKSGPHEEMPWVNDVDFKAAVQNNGTPTLLGGYKTVLRDPLPGEEYNVHLAAKLLAGIVVKPGEVFSQNNSIGPYIEEKGFQKGPTYIGSQLVTTIGGGVCKIASTLYNVSILSNTEIVERHAHSMPVPYVPYGQDATVAYGARDFKFRNNTGSNILIWAQGIDNTLYMAFYGVTKPPKIEWGHEVQSVQKAQKTYKINPSLTQGTEKMLLEGMDGAVVRSWITIIAQDGTKKIKQLGISSYRPMNHLYEKAQ
ncbi:MAG: VanW family protein [Bacteroidota bacterium]|nr:VanW family protein [Bacteroidota bacterium]